MSHKWVMVQLFVANDPTTKKLGNLLIARLILQWLLFKELFTRVVINCIYPAQENYWLYKTGVIKGILRRSTSIFRWWNGKIILSWATTRVGKKDVKDCHCFLFNGHGVSICQCQISPYHQLSHKLHWDLFGQKKNRNYNWI